MIGFLRSWIRSLQIQRTSTPALVKVILSTAMLPAFVVLLIVLRGSMIFHRKSREAFCRTQFGARFKCHPPDLIQMYIWLFGVWEPDLTHFIQRRLRKGDAFIDVGANIGYYSVLASGIVGENGRIAAIEAAPPIFADLHETLQLNHCHNVRAINKAAADQPGTLNIYAGPSHNIGLTTTVRERGLPLRNSIEALPLDQLLSEDEIRSARLIKIDVEGGEDAVLAGMRELIERSRDDLEILVELSPAWWSDRTRRPIDVLQPFIDAGFHVYQMDNSYWPWRYLWPNCVRRPRRATTDLTRRVKRLDLVLSRLDADEI